MASKLDSQVSVDADPITPRGTSMIGVPRSSRHRTEELGQSSVFMDAIAGPEDASRRNTASLLRMADEQQQQQQQQQALRLQQGVEQVAREQRMETFVDPSVTNSRSLDPSELRELDLKMKSSHISSSYSDSSYGSMSSSESCSSMTPDDWLVELKQYEKEMPPNIRMGYLDVLILYHEDDREAAERFRQHLMTEIDVENGPIKTMLYNDPEMEAICGSLIGHLDQAVQRSTYVFIYMTKTFVSDKWCEFQSESCLMEAITNPHKMWCVVPVYTEKRNSTFRVPMGLNTLKGVNYYNNDKFYRKGVSRLIGDKINVRIQADKEHKKKQKTWLEDYKRKQYQQAEEMKRVKLYEEERTRKAKEHYETETQRLIQMGVLPSALQHSMSETDLQQKHPVLHHSQSVNSLKPIQQQNPAVAEYFKNLHQQSSQGLNGGNYTPEQLAHIQQMMFERSPLNTPSSGQHISPNNPESFPPVASSANYAQNHHSVQRSTSQLSPDMPPSSVNVPDLPVEIVEKIQHLSPTEQAECKQEYYNQIQKLMQQQDPSRLQQQQQHPSQQIINQQQNMQQAYLQQQYYQQQQQQQQQPNFQQKLQHHQNQHQYYAQQLQSQKFQPNMTSVPQDRTIGSSVHQDMLQQSVSDVASRQGPGSTINMPNGPGSTIGMPVFDKLNSASSIGSGHSMGSHSTNSIPYQTQDNSRPDFGNLPNNSLLSLSNETDGGPSSPEIHHNSTAIHRVPDKQETSLAESSSDSETDVKDTEVKDRKLKRKKEVIINKHVTINVYQASNVQIGDHNLVNQVNQNSDDDENDDDDDDDDDDRTDKLTTTDPPQTMKKMDIPSGARSHAELGPATAAGPCTVDAAPSTVPDVRNMSVTPDIHVPGDAKPVYQQGIHVQPSTKVKEVDDCTIENIEEEYTHSNTKNDEFQQSAKSVERSQKFERSVNEQSVNMNSSVSDKQTANSHKDIPMFTTPVKPVARTKPQVALVSPIRQDKETSSDPPNDNEDVTCLKTVVDTEYTDRKLPVTNNWFSDDNSQTFVKDVFSERHVSGSSQTELNENQDSVNANTSVAATNHVRPTASAAPFSVAKQTNPHQLFYRNHQQRFNNNHTADDDEIDVGREVTVEDDPGEVMEPGEIIEEGVRREFEVINSDEHGLNQASSENDQFRGSGRMESGRWRQKGSPPKNKNECCLS